MFALCTRMTHQPFPSSNATPSPLDECSYDKCTLEPPAYCHRTRMDCFFLSSTQQPHRIPFPSTSPTGSPETRHFYLDDYIDMRWMSDQPTSVCDGHTQGSVQLRLRACHAVSLVSFTCTTPTYIPCCRHSAYLVYIFRVFRIFS